MFIHPNRRAAVLLFAIDLLASVVVLNFVAYFRHVISHPIMWPAIAPVLVFMLALYLVDGYGAEANKLSLDYASLHLIASVSATLVILLGTFVFVPAGFGLQSSRAALIVSFSIMGVLSLAYRRYLYARAIDSMRGSKIVFIGRQSDFDIFAAECARLGNQRTLMHADSGMGYKGVEDILEQVAQGKIHVEAIVLKESESQLTSDISIKLMQLYFKSVPTYTLELFHQIYWRKIPLYRINPIWLFQDGFKVAREPVFERIKRVSDLAFATVGLIVFSPVILVCALAIKLDDGGPVLFEQTRIGKQRVPFKLLKLRTMRQDSGKGDPYTRQGDARITRVGRWLRSGRLDELPQLWNVLCGQMSLIGPRAEWDRLVLEYEVQIPSYNFRHLVKPGITGWAQVNYRYGSDIQDTLRKLEYDLYYIRNFSFTLDASIILKTLHVMLFRKGH